MSPLSTEFKAILGGLRAWSGTATELAERVTGLLEPFGLAAEPVPSERLVRYYVTEGVLSRPMKEGREAKFGFRQILEFLAARVLLADGWTLNRIRDFNVAADEALLVSLLPQIPPSEEVQQAPPLLAPAAAPAPAPEAAETTAQRLLRKFRFQAEESRSSSAPPPPGGAAKKRAREAPETAKSAPVQSVALEQVRQRAQQRWKGEENTREVRSALRRLGVDADFPERTGGEVRWTIAPWCDARITPDTLLPAYEAAVRDAGGDAARGAEQLIEDAARVFRAALEEEIRRLGKSRPER